MFYIRKYIFHLTFLIPLKYIVTAILGIKNLRESVPVQFRRMYSYKTFSVYFLFLNLIYIPDYWWHILQGASIYNKKFPYFCKKKLCWVELIFCDLTLANSCFRLIHCSNKLCWRTYDYFLQVDLERKEKFISPALTSHCGGGLRIVFKFSDKFLTFTCTSLLLIWTFLSKRALGRAS